MSFKIGFELTDLDELLDDPWEIESNYANLLYEMYWLSERLFWLEIEGQTVPAVHPDWLVKYPEEEYRYGSRHALVQSLTDLGRVARFINDPMPHEIIAVIRSGKWVDWRWSINNLMELGEVKQEFLLYKHDIEMTLSWWQERSVDVHYVIHSPIEIAIWPINSFNLQINWRVRERSIDGVMFTGEQSGDTITSKFHFLNEVRKFRNDLVPLLYARIEDVKRRGLEDALVRVEEGTHRFGGDNILKSLKERLHSFDEDLTDLSHQSTDWPATLAAIRTLEPLIGPLF